MKMHWPHVQTIKFTPEDYNSFMNPIKILFTPCSLYKPLGGIIIREEPQHLVIRIYGSFYSFERGQISVVCERQKEGDKTDCYIDP